MKIIRSRQRGNDLGVKDRLPDSSRWRSAGHLHQATRARRHVDVGEGGYRAAPPGGLPDRSCVAGSLGLVGLVSQGRNALGLSRVLFQLKQKATIWFICFMNLLDTNETLFYHNLME
jgi:hypothetical protein